MTKTELLQACQAWLGDFAAYPVEELPVIPIADLDVFENDRHLVNRLFFLVPDTSSGSLRCFFFFEENTFAKDPVGDLSLIKSSFHLIVH
ncbi:hypothetical protein [Acutalibacter sp. 1XD8-33]|uniref:hypothetical protein n=1 Tax=Acutalibacter sp. 1XD8-33 TaxID=2320081 RepID=UPI0011C35F61|nr:hypothetical protein [Acutalibacter sp. 1XD8-33]